MLDINEIGTTEQKHFHTQHKTFLSEYGKNT